MADLNVSKFHWVSGARWPSSHAQVFGEWYQRILGKYDGFPTPEELVKEAMKSKPIRDMLPQDATEALRMQRIAAMDSMVNALRVTVEYAGGEAVMRVATRIHMPMMDGSNGENTYGSALTEAGQVAHAKRLFRRLQTIAAEFEQGAKLYPEVYQPYTGIVKAIESVELMG